MKLLLMTLLSAFGLLCSTLVIAPKNPEVTIQLKYYRVTFDEQLKVPVCNYYTLHKNTLTNSGAKRSPSFHQEPKIPAQFQATDKDYSSANHGLKGKDNTFDKGHLCPDDDFRFTSDAEPACMTYANVAPQISSFNEVLWRAIESYVRKLEVNYDSIQCYTGCIYGTKKIGNGISVPDYYYKSILCYKGGRGTATESWLCLNAAHTDKDITHYIVKELDLEAKAKRKLWVGVENLPIPK